MVTYVYRNGKLVDKRRAKPKYAASEATHVISDTMDPTQHMATGKIHTSKAAFRRDTRASGCIEYGNETKALLTPRKRIPLDPVKRREDIRQSIYNLRNGRA